MYKNGIPQYFPLTFAPGDLVRITYRGEVADGMVFCTSGSGRKVAVFFDSDLGDYSGVMIIMDCGGAWQDFFNDEPVLIEHRLVC